MDQYALQVRDHLGNTFNVAIARFPFWIGRGAENDLVLNEPSVSKRHAFLSRVPGGLAINDNESRNGVFLNKEKERLNQPRPLAVGDTLRIGLARIRLQRSGAPEIPLHTRALSTLTFVPTREAWDPIQKLTTGLARSAGGPAQRDHAPGWQKMLSRLLLEASTPGVYELMLDMVEEAISFDRCFIVLFERGDPEEISIAAKRVRGGGLTEVFVSRSILQRVVQTSEAVIVSAEEGSHGLTESFIRSGAHAAICVPLVVGGKVTGVLYLDRLSARRALSQEDVESIGPLAGLIALKLENLQLLQEHVEAEVLKRDLDLAKSIQESLLPQEIAAPPGYAVEGFSESCYQVGGDYFDVFSRGGDEMTLVIGDVSGKGLSSAMYMACVRSMLHAHIEDGLSVAALMLSLAQHTRSTFRTDHFLTLFLGSLDNRTGVLTYSNAGHLPPVIVRPGGEVVELEVTAPALNLAPWSAYDPLEHRLDPGDLLFLYTDGLIEAENPHAEQFGRERLLACLCGHREQDLRSLRRRLLAEIDAFAGDCRPSDDRTLVLLRREKASARIP